jgi:hypothetical protein
MTSILSYIVGALLLLLAIGFLLACQGRETTVADAETEFDRGLLDESALYLAERIFNPADYRWLRDELGFPHLARILARQRRELAIRWLRGFRSSFNLLVRASQPNEGAESPDSDPAGWSILFQTLRFHFLLIYALLVVRLFGPYHRLVPSFGWLRSPSGLGLGKGRLGVANARGHS